MPNKELSLTFEQVIKARRLHKKGLSIPKIAKRLGSNTSVVWKAIRGLQPYDNPLYDDYARPGKSNPREKYNEDLLVDALWDLIENNLSLEDCSKKYNVDRSHLSHIKAGRYRPEVMERVNRLLTDTTTSKTDA